MKQTTVYCYCISMFQNALKYIDTMTINWDIRKLYFLRTCNLSIYCAHSLHSAICCSCMPDVTIYWVSSTILINILNTIILNVYRGIRRKKIWDLKFIFSWIVWPNHKYKKKKKKKKKKQNKKTRGTAVTLIFIPPLVMHTKSLLALSLETIMHTRTTHPPTHTHTLFFIP